MNNTQAVAFRQIILNYYAHHGRHELPWRIPEADGSFSAYNIMVSELMLQQTQVKRVIPKFAEFLTTFPTAQVLAQAPLGDVLLAWSGLGYNRRAKFLWQAAQKITADYKGHVPQDVMELVKLPGIGKNTAGAIVAYAFNQPAVLIETNIRTVYIHHFFHDQTDVPDAAMLDLVELTIDLHNPRIFYWALMDYGSYLKQTIGNLNVRSQTYAKQSPLEGSRRQIRGRIIQYLLAQPRGASTRDLQRLIADERLESVLTDLVREQLIQQRGETYHLY